MTVNVRPGSLRILHQISHLSSRPPIRSISHAPFACDHHKTYRSHVPLRVATLPRLRPSLPLESTLCFQPCRPASTANGTGWYESLADSTPVHLTEQLLISVHQTTGLPWWASIVCTTVALRTVVTLPLGAYQAVIIAKVCVASRTKHYIVVFFFFFFQPTLVPTGAELRLRSSWVHLYSLKSCGILPHLISFICTDMQELAS